MDYGTESPLVAAQRSAIQQIRGRYERGELTFEAFREGLDAVTGARTPEDCALALNNLPHSHLATLAAFEPLPATPSAPAAPAMRRQTIRAFMSDTKKTRRSWTLAPDTHVRATMASLHLDLRRAQLPPSARLKVRALMSEVHILVPDDVHVTVRSTAWLSHVLSLGEDNAGIITTGEEEHHPATTTPRAYLEIEVAATMAEVKIAVINANAIPVADLAQEAMRAALEGIRRGFMNGIQSPATLPPSPTGLPRGYRD